MDSLLNINIFDGVVIGLIVLLSIKGLLSGFAKEFFNSIALIGGIFVATLYKSIVAQYAKDNLNLNLSTPLLELLSIIVIFISIFLIVKFIYKIVDSFLLDDEISATSRLAGMLIKVVTLFFIFSLITYALSSKPQVTDKFKDTLTNSKLYPLLTNTGATILNAPNILNNTTNTINNNGTTQDIASSESNQTNIAETKKKDNNKSLTTDNNESNTTISTQIKNNSSTSTIENNTTDSNSSN